MKRFIQGESRTQLTLFPERLDDYVAECNPVRVIEVFVDGLILANWILLVLNLKSPDVLLIIPPRS